MVVFRLLHIFPGVLWVGSSFLFVGIIEPPAAKVDGATHERGVKGRKAAKVITALGGINVVVSWILWFRNADLAGSLENWVTSGSASGSPSAESSRRSLQSSGHWASGRGVEHLVDLSDELSVTETPLRPSSRRESTSCRRRWNVT